MDEQIVVVCINKDWVFLVSGGCDVFILNGKGDIPS
jgi:hypothetical protein